MEEKIIVVSKRRPDVFQNGPFRYWHNKLFKTDLHEFIYVLQNIGSPLTGVGRFPNGQNGLQMGFTNYLLTGMILQVNKKWHPGYSDIPNFESWWCLSYFSWWWIPWDRIWKKTTNKHRCHWNLKQTSLRLEFFASEILVFFAIRLKCASRIIFHKFRI